MYHFEIQRFAHILTTLYLFTCDDLITIVLTNTICGTALPLASGLLQQPASIGDLVIRVPLVSCWVWINLLLFNISNQSQPGAILEDSTNKPWRPLPAGCLNSGDVGSYKNAVCLSAFLISFAFGGTYPSFCLQILTFWYNDLSGGEHWSLRNLINAGGYLCFIVGAMQVAVGVQVLHYSNIGWEWLCCTSVIVASTMHIQDIYDQEGDKLRGRKTVPLVFGDATARYAVIFPVLVFSFLAPAFWMSTFFSFLPSAILGITIAIRLIKNVRGVLAHDKRTFIYWSCWVISIHMLPLWAQLSAFGAHQR